MARLVMIGGYYEQLRVQVELPPNPGNIATDGRFATVASGAGSQQAIAAAQAGAHVTFVGAVGEDTAGEIGMAQWLHDSIDTTWVTRISDAPTGREIVIAGEEGDPLIALAPGANQHLSTAHIRAAQTAIAAADIVLATLEVPPNIVAYAFKLAKLASRPTLLYPFPLQTYSRAALFLADTLILDEAGAAQLGEALVGKNYVIRLDNGAIRWRDAQNVGTVEAPTQQNDMNTFCGTVTAFLAQGHSLPEALHHALSS